MTDYEGFRKVGKFTLDTGVEVQGELILKGSATSLSLHADTPFELHDNSDISGVFYDGEKVSLIKCIGIVSSGKSRCFANIFPHFVLLSQGNEPIHIRYADQIIDKISFTIDDAHKIFYDTSTFGHIFFDTRAKLERLLEGEKPKRKIELGSHPRILYFTDKFEIISIDTVFGKISANNYTSEKLHINEGLRLDNTVKIDIELKSKVTIGESIVIIYDLLLFLEIIAGRPQNISQLKFLSMNSDEHSNSFDVYICDAQRHEIDIHSSIWPTIEAVQNPDEFSRVLKYWAEQHEERRHARVRFSEAFAHQNNYTIDRLIGAANMFDLLPASIYQGTVKRQKSIVLKDKVKHRSKLITDKVGKYFPKIALVIDKAVDLRNYYVHGTKKNNINYSKISGQVMFFTDTLEFIFAASELVEAGWDIAAWIKEKFPSEHHPFRTYHLSYRERLDSLNKFLAEKV